MLLRLRSMLLLLLLASLGQAQVLTVLATGDMHGWVEPVRQADGTWKGGAAETLALWKEQGLAGRALVLGAGDLYTGPSISTYFKGGPVPEAMNALGYRASALGNHEFDFGVPQLVSLAAATHADLLACNLSRTTATAPDLPVKPYIVFPYQGLKVGVVGLTLRHLSGITSSQGWEGTDYAAALRACVPKARAEGAQLIIVIGHVPYPDLATLAEQVQDLGVTLFIGGHSHEATLGRSDSGAWVINNGCFWQSYGRVDLDFNPKTGKTTVLSARLEQVRSAKPALELQAQMGLPAWQQRLAKAAGPTLGYCGGQGLTLPWPMANFVNDACLAADPKADISLCNLGGLRQDLPAGPINDLQLLSAMPFNNSMVAVTMSGQDLLGLLPLPGPSFWKADGEILMPGGLHQQGDEWILNKTKKPIEPKASYRVLINSFVKDKNPHLNPLQAEVVDKDWRGPLVAFLKAHPTSQDKPLETLIDSEPRAGQ